ncbi:NAD(P)-binding protein [Gloeopeniophorella convolvens]|nr:NAD(P)-binding protein [Gloeopeniophorella convolvens]
MGSTARVVTAVALGGLIPFWAVYKFISNRRRSRRDVVSPEGERVLVLGASSGIGRAIAHSYARRGARVCVVARRVADLTAVQLECEALAPASDSVLSICADFTNAEDLVRLREKLHEEWHGLDTLVVAAGVSALRPVLEIADAEGSYDVAQPSLGGIQRVADVALAAVKANYLGPLVSVVTMIPLMRSTSASPSVLLLSSLGSVIPAPTRAIYGSTKAASYQLYQALSIENPSINFSYVLPSTVEGNFRLSAVDLGPTREANPAQAGLKREVVAEQCIRAIDTRERTVFTPAIYRYAQLLFWFYPSWVERKASKKYNYKPT